MKTQKICSKRAPLSTALVFLCFSGAMLLAPTPHADALELHLPGLIQGAGDPQPGNVSIDKFRGLLEQVSDLMVPLNTDGGNTSGALGFEAGVGLGFGVISGGNAGWEDATRNSSNAVSVLAIGLRKGLPWATELGMYMSNIPNSSIWAFGVELEAAPVDGLAHIPDISIATGVGSSAGTGDMSMVMVSNRVTVSKNFAPSVQFALVPFVGFQSIFVRGFISVLTSPKTGSGPSTEWSEQLPPATLGWVNRGVGGIRGLLGPMNITLATSMSQRTKKITLQFGLRY